jgi:serine/threonine-protein kinase HipA
MIKAKIFYDDILAGTLTETDDGYYTYQYNENYIADNRKGC